MVDGASFLEEVSNWEWLENVVGRSEAVVHSETAMCSTTYSNRLRAVKVASSELEPAEKVGVRKETSEDVGDINYKNDAGSSNVGGPVADTLVY